MYEFQQWHKGLKLSVINSDHCHHIPLFSVVSVHRQKKGNKQSISDLQKHMSRALNTKLPAFPEPSSPSIPWTILPRGIWTIRLRWELHRISFYHEERWHQSDNTVKQLPILIYCVLILKIYLLLFYVYLCFACIYTMCMPTALGGQKALLNPPELGYRWLCRCLEPNLDLLQEQQALYHWATSPA